MDAVTLGAANAFTRKTGRGLALRLGALLPLPSVGTRSMWPSSLSNGTNTGQNSGVTHYLTADVSEIRLLYVNVYGAESTPGNAITIRSGLQLASGSVVPVTFRGSQSVVIDNGASVLSDPIPVTQARGTVVLSRTYVSVTTGQKFPLGFFGGYGSDGAETGTSITDKSASGSIPVTYGLPLYGPAAVIGRSGTGTFTASSYAGIGDSIMWGQGDGELLVNAGVGWAARAMGGTRSFLDLGFSGELGQNFGGNPDTRRTRILMAQGATKIITAYGRNDVSSWPLTSVVGFLISTWNAEVALGAKVWQTTITPRTTSTDGWFTAGGQSTDATETVRVQVNTWIRDGAPMLNGAYAAAGSNAGGTLRAGAVGHPLTGYIEVADAVETARNSGIWVPDPSPLAVTGLSATASSTTVTSATAQFSSANLHKWIRIPGAGSGGADYIGRIDFLNSSTSIGVNFTVQTTVSGVAGTIAYRPTTDGLHPTSWGHGLIAAAVPMSTLDAA